MITLLSLMGDNAISASSDSTYFQKEKAILSAGLGYSFLNDFNNQYLAISPYIFDLYTNSAKHDKASVFFSVKKPFYLRSNFVEHINFGPALYWQKVQYTGEVWELGLPLFYNYQYKFHGDLVNFLIESDVYGHPILGNVFPYITAGIGLGVAFAKYNDYALPGIPLNTQFQWSGAPVKPIYEFGVGLFKPINEHWSAFLRYAYFGTNKLKADVSPYQPLTVDLNNQNVIVGLNYSLS
jgi:hypothetical protein